MNPRGFKDPGSGFFVILTLALLAIFILIR